MATVMFRSSIRSALRGGAPRVTPASKRTFASHASIEEEAREACKWEKITYVAIISSTILVVVNLSKDHSHGEEPPAYPYLHICNKEFPWGPDGLPSTTETAWFLCEGIKIIPVRL